MDVEPRILVVDDEENLLRSVEKTLLREGFDVETADGNIAASILLASHVYESLPQTDTQILEALNEVRSAMKIRICNVIHTEPSFPLP